VRLVGLVVALLGCAALTSVVPIADADASLGHVPTILRAGDDRRDEGTAADRVQKAQPKRLPRSLRALHRQMDQRRAAQEHRALAPVIAALKQAVKDLPEDSDWRWACQGIVSQMESARPHLAPAAEPAPVPTSCDPRPEYPPTR